MLNKKPSLIKGKFLFFLVSCFFVFFIWWISSLLVKSDLIIPSPIMVLGELFELLAKPDFYNSVSATIIRAFIAFSLAFFSAFILGALSAFNKIFQAIFSPFVSIIRTIPFISIILLALIWFKSDTVPIFACFLVIFPIIYTNIYEGIKSLDESLIKMARLYNKSSMEIYFHIYLPGILPFTIASISSSLGICWKIIIAAEVLSEPINAIGSGLQNARLNIDTAEVFAWTLVAIILSLLTELISNFLFARIPWRQNAS